jgi:hypothetical protein
MHQIIDLGSAIRALDFAFPPRVVVGAAMGIVVLRLGTLT